MNDNIKQEITYIYETLIESGVTFYYGSECIGYGEISKFTLSDEDTIELELNGFEEYEVDLYDFIENHSKEGVNYHSWKDKREFDIKLDQLRKAEE
ncbi:hypothetical protein [Clostridium sp.]|uniref:hypothetical protein n=1 Tax=Clostridium sp. TaxID=1506 RepID=UPI003F2D248B